MLYFLYAITIVGNFIKKRSKLLITFALLSLFIIFGWCAGGADSSVYQTRFDMYREYSSMTEPLYTAIMSLMNNLGINYNTWLIILAGIYVLTLGFVCEKLSNGFAGFPIALCAIFPFCLDVSQQRNTFALIFLLLAMVLLFQDEKKYNLRIIIASGLLLVGGTLNHLVFIVYFLIYIPLFLEKKYVVWCAAGCAILGFLSRMSILHVIADFFSMQYKLESTLKLSSYVSVFLFVFVWCVITVSYLLPYLIWTKYYKVKPSYLAESMYKINIFLLCLIPFIFIQPALYRIVQNLSVINYCALTCFLKNEKKGKICKKNILLISICIVFAILNLYLLVISNSNINSVWYPLFEENRLL